MHIEKDFLTYWPKAWPAGRPVISTDCANGLAEILEGGRWGKLVPVGNVELLTTAINYTLKTTKPLDTRLRAVTFQAENLVSQYLDLLLKPIR